MAPFRDVDERQPERSQTAQPSGPDSAAHPPRSDSAAQPPRSDSAAQPPRSYSAAHPPQHVVAGPPSRTRMIIVLGLLVALGPLTIDMYLPALPKIADELSLSSSVAQLTLTGTLAGLAL